MGCSPTKIEQMGADQLFERGSVPGIILDRQLIIGATPRWSPGDILTDKCGTPAFMSLGAKREQQPDFFGVQIDNVVISRHRVLGWFWRSRAVHFLKLECPKIDAVLSCGFILTSQKKRVGHKLQGFWATPMQTLMHKWSTQITVHLFYLVDGSSGLGSLFCSWTLIIFGKPSVLNKNRKNKPYWE